MTGFGGYDNKDGNWGGPPRDTAYNSFGGRSDRSKNAYFNDRGAGSRGRCVKPALSNLFLFVLTSCGGVLCRLKDQDVLKLGNQCSKNVQLFLLLLPSGQRKATKGLLCPHSRKPTVPEYTTLAAFQGYTCYFQSELNISYNLF